MPNYRLTDDTGVMMATAVILLGLALGLPNLTLGIFGFDFSQFDPAVIAILRIGLILLAISIGLKPIESRSESRI